MNTKIISIFWTGGFDSTYRLIDLLLSGYTVEPIYIAKRIDGRFSIQREHYTMKKLRNEIIKTFPHVKKAFLSTVEVRNVFIPETLAELVKDIGFSGKNKATEWSVENGYARHAGQVAQLGKQYLYLGLVSLMHHRPIEMSITNSPGRTTTFFKPITGEGRRKRIDPAVFQAPENEPRSLFRNIRFPIIDMSKLDMYKDAERKGYVHLLYNTWSCWGKTDVRYGEPCGECRNCQKRKKYFQEFQKLSAGQ